MQTKDGWDRQLHIEDYRDGDTYGTGKASRRSAIGGLLETDSTITDLWANSLLELILRGDNLNKAYLQVKPKTKAKVESTECRWMNFCPSEKTRAMIIEQVRNGSYKPNPVAG